MKRLLYWLLAVGTLHLRAADSPTDQTLPVRGFCIQAPAPNRLDEFLKFVEEELAPRSVNVLILRVDYGFQFKSHPELADSNGLSKEDAQRIAAVCQRHQIRIIPLVNLLGHQSWQSRCGKLLQVYPEFDETPAVKFPEKYVWPNADRLYCKSYCPRHPKVHEVVFALVDEVCDAFEADALHAGMDEVFYLGEDQCPRCRGRNKAELFADEVRAIRDHLQPTKRQLWLWGDRLLDGKITGLGEWEASQNDTQAAVDLIPKDVVICDWHYDRPDPTAVYFAMKGLNVVSCPWKNPEVGVAQVKDMRRFRAVATPQMKPRFQGVVQTVWSGAGSFLDQYYGRRPANDQKNPSHSESKCFLGMFEEIKNPK
ncbi:MAG TPA: family 20 glycosylhydrolase [Verrucomicrobiota bacterium]|nr:family 20 glycosylhydrolase [Verrucomicrobiota bacterium]